MPAHERDYSDYMKHLSNVMSIMTLTSGFLFTAYTILITRLPDPNTLTAQSTLLILSIYLSICSYCLAFFIGVSTAYCKNMPLLTRDMAINNILFLFAGTTSMAAAVILMSLLWNLTYLVAAQSIQWALWTGAVYLSILRPGLRVRDRVRIREPKS